MLTKSDKERIEFAVYHPNTNLTMYGGGLNKKYCAASVADGGRSVSHHQCNNGIKKQLGGYGWCTVHYKDLARRMGLDTGEEKSIVYLAQMRWGRPSIVELTVTERAKTYSVVSKKKLFGDSELYESSVSKDGRNVFTKFRAAVEWIATECQEELNETNERVAELEKDLATISKLLKKQGG